ncbi:unnamed protein product [Dovyalis caffra]|uniref:Uncharacterized protein n=1 Tax=Dovyalis caffra TaxID=77055 RepID=A0AAV1SEM1_9ROSI|nr:unnamed protein product [Dovyalis caffra]
MALGDSRASRVTDPRAVVPQNEHVAEQRTPIVLERRDDHPNSFKSGPSLSSRVN